VTVTDVPPAAGPEAGEMLVTVGAEAEYVKPPAATADPLPVVTSTCTLPAAWAGATAVIELSETTVKLVATTPSKVTAVVPVRPVPVMVTDVPAGPEVGEMLVTVGAGAA
jgi:hypothetical protein